jgi:hypothetical protein
MRMVRCDAAVDDVYARVRSLVLLGHTLREGVFDASVLKTQYTIPSHQVPFSFSFVNVDFRMRNDCRLMSWRGKRKTRFESQSEIQAQENNWSFCLTSVQEKRLAALSKFQAKARDILVVTDVASRGLDIPHVDVVLNFDLPQDSKVGQLCWFGFWCCFWCFFMLFSSFFYLFFSSCSLRSKLSLLIFLII